MKEEYGITFAFESLVHSFAETLCVCCNHLNHKPVHVVSRDENVSDEAAAEVSRAFKSPEVMSEKLLHVWEHVDWPELAGKPDYDLCIEFALLIVDLEDGVIGYDIF